MFDLQFQTQASMSHVRPASPEWAVNRFENARWKAENEKFRATLLRHPSLLIDIENIPADELNNCHHGGIRAISIRSIGGTLGRAADFDHHFSPLSDRTRERWVSVMMARCRNIPLPPVELIQVGDCYFVKDGHHRISVARALGETAIDAEVTVWDMANLSDWPGTTPPAGEDENPGFWIQWPHIDRRKIMNEKEMMLCLTRVPLFQHLSNRRLQNLAQMAVRREYPAGTYMVTQGEGGIGLFIIVEGQADAVRTQADGSRVVVNSFGPGDFFGELALLDDGTRTASVVATTPTQCLVLARWDFLSLLKSDSEMTVDILAEMARRFRIMLDAN